MSVIQRSRAKGWRKPEDVVIVTRPTRWGNPYKVGPDCLATTRQEAVDLFREWVTTSDEPSAAWIRERVGELKGKTLACWCSQPGPCHAHVLAELAEEATP